MHEYEMVVLDSLKNGKSLSINELHAETGVGEEHIRWAVESLLAKELVSVERKAASSAVLTLEGGEYAAHCTPESNLIKRVMEEGKLDASKLGEKDIIGLQWAKKNGWIKVEGGRLELTKQGREAAGTETKEESALRRIDKAGGRLDITAAAGKETLELWETLVKRNLVVMDSKSSISSVSITDRGREELSHASSDEIGQLDRQMITSRSWEGKKFREYDVSVQVREQEMAKRHPLRELINEIKQVYMGLGFKEASGPIIEPAFWVMDSLFIPQDHPARDAQDTFYLKNPGLMEVEDKDFVRRVAKEHTKGWHYKWSRKESMRAMLRTHATSVSIRSIRALADADSELPLKLFCVGRVFRNETIDYRHLADFYQMDGIMVGKNLTMTNLFDVLTRIYSGLGFKVRFVPTYFPFVEPGVEIQAYYEPRNEWLEMGGAGIIRREITRAAGKRLNVLAWGPGVERMLLLRDHGIGNISELYGSGIGWLRSNRW